MILDKLGRVLAPRFGARDKPTLAAASSTLDLLNSRLGARGEALDAAESYQPPLGTKEEIASPVSRDPHVLALHVSIRADNRRYSGEGRGGLPGSDVGHCSCSRSETSIRRSPFAIPPQTLLNPLYPPVHPLQQLPIDSNQVCQESNNDKKETDSHQKRCQHK